MTEVNARENSLKQIDELFVGFQHANKAVYSVFEDGEVTIGDATVLVSVATDYATYKAAFEGLNTIDVKSITNKEDIPMLSGKIFNLVDGIIRTYDHSAPSVTADPSVTITEIRELLAGVVRVNKAIGDVIADGKFTMTDITIMVGLAQDYAMLKKSVEGLKNVDLKAVLNAASAVEITALTYDFVSDVVAVYKK